MLSIAILDDDMKTLEDYERIIPLWFKKHNINGKVVVATTDYKFFMKEIRDQKANVCIIDINLRSDANGMFVAKCIRKEKIQTEIIFATGMLEYMLQAFDVNAYHFIPKPINSTLEKCIVKLANEIDSRELSRKTIEIKFGSQIFYVPYVQITYLQRNGTKTEIHTLKRVLEVYDPLEAMMGKLDDDRFKQCHRSTIVNIDHIDYIDIKGKNIFLKNGTKCEIGPKYYSNLKNMDDWSERECSTSC